MRRASIVWLAVVALTVWSGTRELRAQGLLDWGFAVDNGDVNGDQSRDVSDVIYVLSHLFTGGPGPVPLAYCGVSRPAVENGDTNGSGYVDVSDPIRLLGWLFSGGAEPTPACAPGEGSGGGKSPPVAPPGSRAFGKSLAEWLEVYWRWNLETGSDPAQSVVGRVKLLPIPAAEFLGGSGTPADPARLRGMIDVELGPGTPFVIPQFAWISERYEGYPGVPDDPPLPDDALRDGVSPNVTLDGRVVMSDANETDYYVPATAFDPIAVYPAPSSYGSVAAIAYQGNGIVVPPLPVGEHTLTLYEPYIIDGVLGFSFGVIYDNTWHITVSP